MVSEVQNDLPRQRELRRDSRKDLDVPAKLLSHDAIPRPVQLTDISRGGIGLLASEPLQTNDACALAFDVNLNAETKRINVWAKVVYCIPKSEGNFRIGIHFRDYDSHSRMHIEQVCEATGLPNGW